MKIEQHKLTLIRILALAALILALVGCDTLSVVGDDLPTIVPSVESEPPVTTPTTGDDTATTLPSVESEPPVNEPGDTTAEPAAAGPVEESNIHCTRPDVHPIGASISQTYDVPYEEVMSLFCSGFTFDNILLAFQTSRQTGYSPRELLHLKQTMSWDQIWAELGVFDND